MPVRTIRTTEAREAQRKKAGDLLAAMRTDVADLKTAIVAMPAPASRTAAQRRDVLIMRCLIRVIRWNLIAAMASEADDLAEEPA